MIKLRNLSRKPPLPHIRKHTRRRIHAPTRERELDSPAPRHDPVEATDRSCDSNSFCPTKRETHTHSHTQTHTHTLSLRGFRNLGKFFGANASRSLVVFFFFFSHVSGGAQSRSSSASLFLWSLCVKRSYRAAKRPSRPRE